jgi:hypothetical protein
VVGRCLGEGGAGERGTGAELPCASRMRFACCLRPRRDLVHRGGDVNGDCSCSMPAARDGHARPGAVRPEAGCSCRAAMATGGQWLEES